MLWIGYLQWHFRVNGEGKVPPEPMLRDVKTIENRDALITWDKKVLERDEHGKPLTRWDGETMKVHPVTGKRVPDEGDRQAFGCEGWRQPEVRYPQTSPSFSLLQSQNDFPSFRARHS
ncbi:MAG: hypothetical protein U5J78_00665 [Parasphingorhabdus sp.]|nr:hypothetical protein [Parasphingorhabdus sp.]